MKLDEIDWDSLVEGHYQSKFYGVNSFLEGEVGLDHLEVETVGDVKGKSLLHM